jgi:NADPH2:quinone reductase
VVPDAFTTGQALLFQPLTAQYLVHEYRNIRPGDRVLVHAAAGGVGQILVQWLKHLGAWVVGTVSSEAKATSVRALGADAVIVYGSDYAFLDELTALTNGKGIDLAFDGLGEKTLLNTIGSLSRGGTVVAIGAASGPIPSVHPSELTLRCLRLAGGSVFSYVADTSELRQRAAAVISGIEAGWLRIGDGAAYDLVRAADAHRDIESRRTQGKLYLTP